MVVGSLYHVGSFDDDASYVLAARALASGTGLTGPLIPGVPLVGVYPPGYGALLAPLALIWPHSLIAFRALSLVLFLAIFPLTWTYLGRRHMDPPIRLAVLVGLALSPLLATYATMVMPEVPFLVVLLLLLLVIERWEHQRRAITWAGASTILAAAALLWLKEAGVGLVVGLVAWLLLGRLWRKALLLGGATALLFLPVVIARAAAGVALVGSRYSSDFGGAYAGGLIGRVAHVLPHAAFTYLTTALPSSLSPLIGGPFPGDGVIGIVLGLLQLTATPLTIVGFVVWTRHHRDATSVAVPFYLLATLTYPFINERRVILVLPVVVAWYVLGAHRVWLAVNRAARTARPTVVARVGRALPIAAASIIVVTLIGQFPRNYRFHVGQQSSAPDGSSYMAFLRSLGPPSEIVETDYRWTTALFSGHPTANSAFVAPCDDVAIIDAIQRDRASYLLSAALNLPGVILSPCILPLVASEPDAVRLYRTARDKSSVFELVGPGTPRPDVRDVTPTAQLTPSSPMLAMVAEEPQVDGDPAGSYPTLPADGGTAALTWSWREPQPVTQVSLSRAEAEHATGSVVVDLLGADGVWRDVARSAGAVGEEAPTAYLLARFDQPVMATAARVTVAGQGVVAVHDLHVLASGR